MSLIKEYRDLSILPISKGKSLVIACDSSAGIGKKEHDVVEIDPAITAAFCLRVPLMELLCYGAEPIAVIDLIGNEYAPTGERMLKGIREELARAELSNITLNGSTEENMFTKTTSVGITVVAETKAGKENFQMQQACSLLQLGQPYVGEQVVKNRETIFSYPLVKALRSEPGVIDMLPVGSKGIRYEAELMAKDSEFQIHFSEVENLDCSAGPATVILIAVKSEQEADITSRYSELKKIGEYKKR